MHRQSCTGVFTLLLEKTQQPSRQFKEWLHLTTKHFFGQYPNRKTKVLGVVVYDELSETDLDLKEPTTC